MDTETLKNFRALKHWNVINYWMYLPRIDEKTLEMYHIAESMDVVEYWVCLTWGRWDSFNRMTALKHRMVINLCVYELVCTEIIETYHRTKHLMVNNWQVYLNQSIWKKDLKNVIELKQLTVINYCLCLTWNRRRSTWNMSQHWNIGWS